MFKFGRLHARWAVAQAMAHVALRLGDRTLFGVGLDGNIVTASLRAIVSGLQRVGMKLAEAAPTAE